MPTLTIHTQDRDVSIHVEIADTDEERQRGLMYREGMPENQGMLFLFDASEIERFWMKNTLIPLDMLFITEDKTIAHIAHDVQPCRGDPCPLTSSLQPVRYVLETNAGWAKANGVTVGNSILIHNEMHE